MSRAREGTSDVWVCLACEIQWDRNRRKTKLCPQCSCMGVMRGFLQGRS